MLFFDHQHNTITLSFDAYGSELWKNVKEREQLFRRHKRLILLEHMNRSARNDTGAKLDRQRRFLRLSFDRWMSSLLDDYWTA